MGRQTGFTIVELLIVMVVIAILATIGIVAYSGVRQDATDTKIRSIVKIAGDALQIYDTQKRTLPSGQGTFNNANGVDSLVPQYIQPGYREGVSSKNASNPNDIFVWYPCKDTSGKITGIAVFAALNSAKPQESAQVNAVKATCNIPGTAVPTTGKPAYNYVQTF